MPPLIHGTFTVEDGALLTARTPDVNTLGETWLVTRGTSVRGLAMNYTDIETLESAGLTD